MRSLFQSTPQENDMGDKIYTYVLRSPIDIFDGSMAWKELPESFSALGWRLICALEHNPTGDTKWRERPHFGFVPKPNFDLGLWAVGKLDNNGTCVVVSTIPLGYAEADIDESGVLVDDGSAHL